MALVHLALALEGNGMSVSVGLPDRALAPFAEEYSRHPGADRLLAAFLLKLGANSILGRGSKTQAITVGGCDAQGRDCSNAVTDGFLRAADLARVGDPHVFLRCHPGLAPGTQSLAASLLSRGLSMPLLVNDTPTIQGFMAAGVPAEHATRYCVIGCNELGIPGLCCGTAMPRAGTIEYVQLLNDTLYALPDPDGIASLDEVLRVMGERMEERLEAARRQYVHLAPWWSARAPVPLASALMTGPRTRGLDLGLAMTYEFPGLYERGLANAVNALAALHQVVFRDKRAPLSEVIRGLQSNHGDTTLRRALQDSPKWGNDDPEADRWAQRLLELRERVLERVDQSFGHSTHFVCHVIRSLHHLDGGKLAASADGRRAGEPLGDSIGAVTGTARSGATAVLNSVAKIETTRFYRGGCNLNLTLVAGTPEPTVEALITAFFAAGGQELQINCLNPGTLRDAQHCPEHHGDLVVRVAGLSARFVDLGRREQDELIARAEAAAR
jgi:formate C-acetyltransferase